jgi:chromosome segregation ATPase
LEDSTEVIALKAQLATMRTNLNSSETRIAELEQTIRDLEAQANSAEAEQHKADAAQLLILTNANNKYEEDLREKEAEREKLLRELDDLKRVAGEAHDLEAKLAGLTTMLDELKKSNS